MKELFLKLIFMVIRYLLAYTSKYVCRVFGLSQSFASDLKQMAKTIKEVFYARKHYKNDEE